MGQRDRWPDGSGAQSATREARWKWGRKRQGEREGEGVVCYARSQVITAAAQGTGWSSLDAQTEAGDKEKPAMNCITQTFPSPSL